MKTSRAAVSLLLLAATLAHGQTILDLGVLPGHNRSRVDSMSADGSVVFGTSDFSSSQIKAFRWTLPTGIVQIPSATIPEQTFGGQCSNDGSQMAGSLVRASSNISGYRWSLLGGSVDMPLTHAAGPTYASGVTGQGNYVFGRARHPTNTTSIQAYRWSPSGGYQFLGVLPANSFNSGAQDASEDGSVIVGSCDLFGITRPTRWTAATGQQLLGAVNGEAMRVTRDGSVIVGGTTGIWRWDLPGGLVQLPLPPGMNAAAPGDISDDGGLILGSMWNTASFNYQAAAWRAPVGMFNVNTHLTGLGMNLSGWQLESVSAISSDLTTIAGSGLHSGAPRAYRITGIPCWSVPEVLVDGIRSLEICGGQQIELSVLGGGTHAISVFYQWYYNGVALANGPQASGATVSGAQSATLVVGGATPADSGQYHCVVYNQCGTAPTSTTNVIVGAPPVWTALPAPVQVCPAGTATLTAQVFSLLPVTYQWQYLHPTLGWTNVPNGLISDPMNGLYIQASGALTPTLQLSPIFLGAYEPLPFRCVVSNTCGSAPLRGVAANVSHIQPLMLLSSPSNLTTCSQGPANFNTLVTGPSPQYQWETFSYFFNNWVAISDGPYLDMLNGITFTAAGTSTPNLVITNAYLANHDGLLQYRCVVTGPCNSVVTNVATQTVCVGDFDCDGDVDGDDVINFFALWDNGDPGADLNFDNNIDGDDLILFFGGWDAGC